MPEVPEPSPAIDRLAPSLRPDLRPVMYQRWRSLLFLHWAFPPDAVRAFLPPGLDLDLFDGRAYVGLVPFTMRNVRPAGLPAVPWLSFFHETNLRTYVHVAGRDPGVYFFSLEAANPVAVALARVFFHLPYHHARMTLRRDPGGAIAYASERLCPGPLPAATDVACTPRGAPAPVAAGTLDHFLIERYFLYTSGRGGLLRGQVHHPAYPVQNAEVHRFAESLTAVCGLERPPGPPLAHFSPGVDVEIFSLSRVVL